MSLKTRIIFTSELNPPLYIKDDFGEANLISNFLIKIIKPKFDITLDIGGVEYKQVYIPEGEPVPGRITYLIIGLFLVFFLLLIASKKRT